MDTKKCEYCICKTCQIAYINGGAPGCGDCIECIQRNGSHFHNNCTEYYNPKPPQISFDYLVDKALEERDSDDYEVANALVEEIDKKLSAMTDEERDEYFKKMGFVKDE